MIAATQYYNDTFTTDLRLAIFALVGLIIVGFAFVTLMVICAMKPQRNRKRKRPVGVGKLLPQDRAVRMVDSRYPDRRLQPFDFEEWEERVKR